MDSMIEALLADVSAGADELIDEVIVRLLSSLERTGTRVCRKHGELQASASIAAIRLWRHNKRKNGDWNRGKIPYEGNVWALEAERERTSKAYHAAECTCHVNREGSRIMDVFAADPPGYAIAHSY